MYKVRMPKLLSPPRRKLRCWLSHDWNGCVCNRCRMARDAEHQWDGCLCVRCRAVRDYDHDWRSCSEAPKSWEAAPCKTNWRLCARCNETDFFPSHDWEHVGDTDTGDERLSCRRCDATTERQGPYPGDEAVRDAGFRRWMS